LAKEQEEDSLERSDSPILMNIDDRDKAGDPDSDPEMDDEGFSNSDSPQSILIDDLDKSN
jgi:hypothetical protein